MRSLTFAMMLLFLTFLLCSMSIAGDENFARNPDFEDGIVEWETEIHAETGAAAQLKSDKGGVVGDLCALFETQNIDGSGTWWHTGLNQSGHAVKNGVTYTLAFWAKAEVKRKIGACLAENHDPWDNWSMQEFNITPEWQEYWVTWNSPAVDKNARIRIPMGYSKEKVWVDHVRFYEGQYKEEDLGGLVINKKLVEPLGKLAITWAKVKSK